MRSSARRWPASGHLWLVAVLLLLLPLCIDATSDPDLWWHLRTGQWIADHLAIPHTELYSYTAPGAPWVAHEWLAELVFWLVQRGIGVAGLALVVGTVTWSGLIALAVNARGRGASGLAIGAVLLVAAKALQPVTGTRPQMLTFALICWSLLLVESHLRRGGRHIWVLVPLFLVWANLHAGFAVGLALVALTIGGGLLDAVVARAGQHIPWRRFATAAAALLAGAAATLVNPNGVELYTRAVAGSSPAAHRLIQEWQPPDFTSWSMAPLALLMIGTVAALIGARRRVRPSHLLATAVAVGAALLAVRNIAIAVALLSPTVAELLPRIRYRLPVRPAALQVAALAAAVLVVVSGLLSTARAAAPGAVARLYPACLVAGLARASAAPVRLFLPYGQAGLAIEARWPSVLVYAYGEDTTLGPTVINDYVRVASGQRDAPSAPDLLGASHTDAVITTDGPLATELLADGWSKRGSERGESAYSPTPGPALGACPDSAA